MKKSVRGQGSVALDYGIIGNCITSALVKSTGSVDWLCFPDFSSPTVFAKILDNEKGGSFEIKPVGKYKINQRYIPNTAVLETVFTSVNGKKSFVVYDFFPRYKKLTSKGYASLVEQNRLIRLIRPVKGKPEIKIKYDPRPNYAIGLPEFDEEGGSLKCVSGYSVITLSSNVPYSEIMNNEVVKLDTAKYFVMSGRNETNHFTAKKCAKLFTATRRYWEHWSRELVVPDKNKDLIVRSAITLKLLTYSKTGAIIASATTSIPEVIGSQRTFDYRYCWTRDASFAVDALKKIGRDYEAKSLMGFIIDRVLTDDHIQIMYGINGETRLRESELNHLNGFGGSKPVRVGNAAYNQLQFDIYGELIDIMYMYFAYYQYEKRMTKKYWKFLSYLVNQIKFNWDKKDNGLWEFRGRFEHFLFSKFMCYVGIDRALKLAQYYGKEDIMKECVDLRDEIKADILKNGYNDKIDAFTMHYGSNRLDASVLQMAYYEFLDESDPRLVKTIKAIYNKLRIDYLVKRYDQEDNFGTSTSGFTICSFWLIDALHHIGEKKKAKELYQKIIKHANHLGLFSECIDIKSKNLVGNFPQAYTHIALINTSILLSEWSSKRKKIDWSKFPKRKRWF
jgi:alpha,alpha-trehalase